MSIIVFNHLNPERSLSPVWGQFERLAAAARDEGLRVFDLPYQDQGFDDILVYLPEGLTHGIYNGGVTSPAYYEALCAAAAARGIEMVQPAWANELVMHFERFYPVIEDLTAESVVIADEADLQSAGMLGFPLFVKGTVASDKHRGLSACLAKDAASLAEHAARRSPGVTIARRLLDLRLSGEEHNGFPISREYRIYLLRGGLVGLGFYWGDVDHFGELTAGERSDVLALCTEVYARTNAPMLSVDVGQITDGSWSIIELGDPQHTGIGQMAKHVWWRSMREML